VGSAGWGGGFVLAKNPGWGKAKVAILGRWRGIWVCLVGLILILSVVGCPWSVVGEGEEKKYWGAELEVVFVKMLWKTS
jgi:hypothetical protein